MLHDLSVSSEDMLPAPGPPALTPASSLEGQGVGAEGPPPQGSRAFSGTALRVTQSHPSAITSQETLGRLWPIVALPHENKVSKW